MTNEEANDYLKAVAVAEARRQADKLHVPFHLAKSGETLGPAAAMAFDEAAYRETIRALSEEADKKRFLAEEMVIAEKVRREQAGDACGHGVEFPSLIMGRPSATNPPSHGMAAILKVTPVVMATATISGRPGATFGAAGPEAADIVERIHFENVNRAAVRVLAGDGSEADAFLVAKTFLEIKGPQWLESFNRDLGRVILSDRGIENFHQAVAEHAENNRFNPASWTGKAEDARITATSAPGQASRYPSFLTYATNGYPDFAWSTVAGGRSRSHCVHLFASSRPGERGQYFVQYLLNSKKAAGDGYQAEVASAVFPCTEHMLAGALYFLGIIGKYPGAAL